MKRIFAALFAVSIGACTDTTPESDRGGSVLLKAAEIATWSGPVELPSYCSSACTMGLGYDEACVRTPATFGFHAVAGDVTGQARRIYEAHLPAGLRAWYRANAADSPSIVRLSGARLIREGWAVACPD